MLHWPTMIHTKTKSSKKKRFGLKPRVSGFREILVFKDEKWNVQISLQHCCCQCLVLWNFLDISATICSLQLLSPFHIIKLGNFNFLLSSKKIKTNCGCWHVLVVIASHQQTLFVFVFVNIVCISQKTGCGLDGGCTSAGGKRDFVFSTLSPPWHHPTIIQHSTKCWKRRCLVMIKNQYYWNYQTNKQKLLSHFLSQEANNTFPSSICVFQRGSSRALICSVWWQQLSSSLLQRKEERCRIHFEDWRSFCQFEVWQYVLLLDGPLVHNITSCSYPPTTISPIW